MKNWKTTLTGVGGGLLISISALIQANSAGGKINWSAVGVGAIIAVLGLVSKDHNVTGGTVDQTTK